MGFRKVVYKMGILTITETLVNFLVQKLLGMGIIKVPQGCARCANGFAIYASYDERFGVV